MQTLHPSLFINGTWSTSHGKAFHSTNPCDNSHPWSGNSCNASDINNAVESARKSFLPWAALEVKERENFLKAFSQQIKENLEWIAEAISLEVGKPIWESRIEVSGIISKVDLSISAFSERCAEVTRGVATTRFKPHGVAVVIGAFNFPAHITHGHIIPALLAGNTVIFKPSRETPLVGERLIKLWEKTNIPAGVINLVQGQTETAKILSTHPRINALFFTGSTRVGIILNEYFSKHPDRVLALEMGGNNPLVVHNIENLEAAAYQVVQSAYLTSGQRCTCARRLIITDFPLREPFIEKLASLIKTITVASPSSNPEPFMGPVISIESANNILDAQADWIQNGAQPIVELKQLKPNTPFLSPGLIDVTNMKTRADKEIFGPLLQLIKVKDLDAAIAEANNTQYGLTAAILTDIPEAYEKFRLSVNAGIINWNQQTTGASGAAPFGGIGLSGNHKPTGYFAADYCSYPVASIEHPKLSLPEKTSPGLKL